MSAYLIQQIVNGLVLGSMYALVAVGFSMIYSIVRLINFAQGDIVMIGALTAVFCLMALGLPLWVTVLATLAAGAALAALIEVLVFRPQRGAPQVNGFITSLAVSILIQNLGVMLLSAQPRPLRLPSEWRGGIDMFGARLSMLDIGIFVSTAVSLAGLVYFVRFTRMGIAMRATSENLTAARLMGIPVNRVVMTAFAVGGALAGLAGLLWGGRYGQVDPLMGFVPGLKAFVAAVIGGVGSLTGAVLGGFLLGLAEVLLVGLLPQEFGAYRDAFVFALLIVVLLVLPSGLMGHSTEERA
ncbi:branched-chain amino acid ABC transporter permease [Aureimonas frigidaquae]|uniref:Putative branched-chain amino acid ABC transporter permease protein n=1 Tax=Aureimonas frigidaquae TaxID=424757 RepID=A0A0P0Z0L0_9HYPH|nr:branched-chain amino acid ABC transporter permease [Aureimonas frigidaquae]BAT27430.1 putative branched-chain amino acid ABC transporter permease protein [Aureimonas frigidaquae]